MPGHVKVLSREVWYGQGGCDICGERYNLIPRAVRYWSPDDGWKMGVLCGGCTAECDERGPQEGDYAVCTRANQVNEEKQVAIDIVADLLVGDLDGALGTLEDLGVVP